MKKKSKERILASAHIKRSYSLKNKNNAIFVYEELTDIRCIQFGKGEVKQFQFACDIPVTAHKGSNFCSTHQLSMRLSISSPSCLHSKLSNFWMFTK